MRKYVSKTIGFEEYCTVSHNYFIYPHFVYSVLIPANFFYLILVDSDYFYWMAVEFFK